MSMFPLPNIVNSVGVGNPQWVGTHTHGGCGCGCGLEFLNPQATHTHIVGYPHPPLKSQEQCTCYWLESGGQRKDVAPRFFIYTLRCYHVCRKLESAGIGEGC